MLHLEHISAPKYSSKCIHSHVLIYLWYHRLHTQHRLIVCFHDINLIIFLPGNQRWKRRAWSARGTCECHWSALLYNEDYCIVVLFKLNLEFTMYHHLRMVHVCHRCFLLNVDSTTMWSFIKIFESSLITSELCDLATKIFLKPLVQYLCNLSI